MRVRTRLRMFFQSIHSMKFFISLIDEIPLPNYIFYLIQTIDKKNNLFINQTFIQ
jgi:hypothetical protein